MCDVLREETSCVFVQLPATVEPISTVFALQHQLSFQRLAGLLAPRKKLASNSDQ